MTDVEGLIEAVGCEHCRNEPEPGWIEMPNNGPIGPCPICNADMDDYALAELQRDAQRAAALNERGE